MSAKQVEVQIMGQSYLLGCPEDGESQLRAAVGRVDTAMCKIRDAGKIKARDRIAVLAALNLAFEQNTPAAAPVSSSNAELSQEGSARLVSLLHRLDQTLNQDGQLI
jgi:cell division protein ZapA